MSVLAPARRSTIVETASRTRPVVGWALAACLVALVVPVLATDVLPLFDLPNHLARIHVLARWDAVPAFRAQFERDGLLIPNVLADLVLLGLAKVTDVATAGRLLVGGSMVATGAGVVALGRIAAGRTNPWPLLALPLAVHEMLMWGFLNYLLGLAILFWALAGWLWLDGRSRAGQLALGTAAAFALFLAHLVAFGLFAVAVATIELHRALTGPDRRPARMAGRLAASAAVFVPATAVFLLASPSTGLPLDPLFDQTLWGRLSPYARLASTGHPALDDATLGLVALAGILGLASGRATPGRPLALVALAWFGLSQVLPYSMMGSFFLESRIAIAVAFVALAALAPVRFGRAEAALALAVVALVVVRSGGIAVAWRAEAAVVRPMLDAIAALPRGAIVASASALPFELGGWRQTRTRRPPEEHLGAAAGHLADAVVPSLFARRGQNPLVFAPAHPSIGALNLPPWKRLDDAEVRHAFAADAVAADAAGFGPVFVIGFGVPCDGWPDEVPLAPQACLALGSIMRAGR